jgi:hypothetical protein
LATRVHGVVKEGAAECPARTTMAKRAAMHLPASGAADLYPFLTTDDLTEGQRRRIALFQSLEEGVCARVEQMCATSSLDVPDVAVLVVSPEAQELLFESEDPPSTSVILGHRERLHAFLHSALPVSPEVPIDPYADLLLPAPPRCVRVLIVDDDSLTILSYGTFLTFPLDGNDVPDA